MSTNFCKLMNKSSATKYCIIVDFYFTCQLSAITKYYIIIKNTVVSNMAVSHNQTVFPDFCKSFGCSSPVNSCTFTYCSIITYFSNCLFTLKFKILWYPGNCGMREYCTILTDTGTVEHGCISHNSCSVANFCILIYECKGLY